MPLIAFAPLIPLTKRPRNLSNPNVIRCTQSNAHPLTNPAPVPAKQLPALPQRPFVLHTLATEPCEESARRLLENEGVLRCDVFQALDKKGRIKERDSTHIWTLYENAMCAQRNTAPGMTFVEMLQPIYPPISHWRYTEFEEGERHAQATMSILGLRAKETEGSKKVTLVIARAKVVREELLPGLIGVLEKHIEEEDMVWGGVLMSENEVVVVSVHEEGSGWFESDLGGDFVTGWNVRRYKGVFPGSSGWGNEEVQEEKEEESRAFLKEAVPFESGGYLTTVDEGEEESGEKINMRLLQGVSAFDETTSVLKQMSGGKDVVKVMIVTGWNASRSGTLLNQLEDRKGIEAKFVFRFGVQPEGGGARTYMIRKGWKDIQEFEPDVIIGFGGGSVMDAVKVLGGVGCMVEEEVDKFCEMVDRCETKEVFDIEKGIPIMLIPGNVGSGCEMLEASLLRNKAGKSVIVEVVQKNRRANERVILIDSRLISPSRLSGQDAAQGALQVVCRSMEIMMGIAGGDGMKLAEEALTEASESIMHALREPERATGASRDALTNAKTKMGMGMECLGRLGICTRITLRVLDGLIDGVGEGFFRMVLIRVTASVMAEVLDWEGIEQIRTAFMVQKKEDIAKRLLNRAEDCDVWLLREMGMVRRKVEEVALRIAQDVKDESMKSDVEKRFEDVGVVKKVLQSALSQDYKL